MYVLTLFLAATTFLGTLATAQGSAQGFAQEYNIVDGVPCTKQPDESWLCIDGNVNTTVYAIPSPAGSVYVDRLSTFFGSIFQMNCTGLTSVSTVRANNYFEVILDGQDLTFTDAAPCTAGADSGF
ncbi:hypothetical protein LZ32DRAFT_658064 [Colletotrichum eremochloae]|nr:hypothetical protein LZ32DRAFT_658064 [Colletotrichum eremochloae]